MATAEGGLQSGLYETANKAMKDRCVEAMRLVDSALTEINEGHYEKAAELLDRAQTLNTTTKGTELQGWLQKLSIRKPASSSQGAARRNKTQAPSSEQPSTSAGVRKRKQAPVAPLTVDADYTSDQVDLVKHINGCTDFYEVLSVTRDDSDATIKKSYKRLALQLHPDKNRAPGAVEAFKTVANAVGVLCDAVRRKEYDASLDISRSLNGGSMNANGNGTDTLFNHFNYARYDDDISAEELFNMFFGNFPPQHMQQQQHRRPYQTANQRQPQETHQQPSLVFGLLLVLVLILISMMSSLFTSASLYNLARTSKYPVRRETQHLSVPYYVSESFESDYRGSLGRLEHSVEEDFIYTMKQNCYRERSYREAMLARARSFGSRTEFAQAQSMRTPSCDNLSRIGITRYSLF